MTPFHSQVLFSYSPPAPSHISGSYKQRCTLCLWLPAYTSSLSEIKVLPGLCEYNINLLYLFLSQPVSNLFNQKLGGQCVKRISLQVGVTVGHLGLPGKSLVFEVWYHWHNRGENEVQSEKVVEIFSQGFFVEFYAETSRKRQACESCISSWSRLRVVGNSPHFWIAIKSNIQKFNLIGWRRHDVIITRLALSDWLLCHLSVPISDVNAISAKRVFQLKLNNLFLHWFLTKDKETNLFRTRLSCSSHTGHSSEDSKVYILEREDVKFWARWRGKKWL